MPHWGIFEYTRQEAEKLTNPAKRQAVEMTLAPGSVEWFEIAEKIARIDHVDTRAGRRPNPTAVTRQGSTTSARLLASPWHRPVCDPFRPAIYVPREYTLKIRIQLL